MEHVPLRWAWGVCKTEKMLKKSPSTKKLQQVFDQNQSYKTTCSKEQTLPENFSGSTTDKNFLMTVLCV